MGIHVSFYGIFEFGWLGIFFYILASPQEAQEINAMILDLRQAATWSADTFVVRTEDALSLLLGHGENNEKSSQNET